MMTRRTNPRGRTAVLGAAIVALSAGSVVGATAPAQAQPTGYATIQEFRTTGNHGWFYTTNSAEAAKATSKYKFTKSANIGKLRTAPGPGTIAVHRLRLKRGGPSYMLSISPTEEHSSQFVDEGVMGYTSVARGAGEQPLVRFSNHSKWRVLSGVPANIRNMKKAGYRVDGPMGYYRP